MKKIIPFLMSSALMLTAHVQVGAQDRHHNSNHNSGGGRPVSEHPVTRPSGNITRPSGNITRPIGNTIRPVRPTRPVFNPPIRPANVYRPVTYRPNYPVGYRRYGYERIRYPYIHYGPVWGYRLSILPFGYYYFYCGGFPYYYYQGIYYRPYHEGGYEVVAPPLGARISSLPPGAKARIIDGQKYYELGGTFYEEQISSDNRLWYVVVGVDGVLNTGNASEPAPATGDSTPNQTPQNVSPGNNNLPIPEPGTRINTLPAGSKTVIINQQKFFESPDGVYYQEIIDGDTVSYEVVGNATEKLP